MLFLKKKKLYLKLLSDQQWIKLLRVMWKLTLAMSNHRELSPDSQFSSAPPLRSILVPFSSLFWFWSPWLSSFVWLPQLSSVSCPNFLSRSKLQTESATSSSKPVVSSGVSVDQTRGVSVGLRFVKWTETRLKMIANAVLSAGFVATKQMFANKFNILKGQFTLNLKTHIFL